MLKDLWVSPHLFISFQKIQNAGYSLRRGGDATKETELVTTGEADIRHDLDLLSEIADEWPLIFTNLYAPANRHD